MAIPVDLLTARLDAYPRLPLADYPTPLQFLSRLSKEIGRPIYLKRDDLIGPALGGNKTRKLEYLMADAQQRGAKKVVTFGGLQSNHARLTAAVARQCGMEPHLFYFDRRPATLAGNLHINELLDAHLHFIPFGGGDGGMTLESAIRLVRLLALAQIGPHYFIPVGGHNWLGCLGYVRAGLELDWQATSMRLGKAHVVVAAGSGGTLAGLMAGFALAGSALCLQGIDVGKLWKGFPHSIAHLAGQLCERLGEGRAFAAQDVPLIEGRYVGEGYGKPTPECRAALRRLAQTEGVLLDPVYTAKAFAGMLDLAQRGQLGRDEPLIFIHTGGLPALFAFDDL